MLINDYHFKLHLVRSSGGYERMKKKQQKDKLSCAKLVTYSERDERALPLKTNNCAFPTVFVYFFVCAGRTKALPQSSSSHPS